MTQISTKEELVAFAESKGSHFFEKATMSFFASRVLEDVVTKNGFVYFVTSEQFRDRGRVAARKYSVRSMNLESASTDYAVGGFQDFADARTAKAAMHNYLNAPEALMYVVVELYDGLVSTLTVCDTESEAQDRLMCLENKGNRDSVFGHGYEGSCAYVILSDKTTRLVLPWQPLG